MAPTFNNAGTLFDVLRRIDATGLPLIVVNDGSTDQTPAILAGWQADHPPPRCIRADHVRNLGKAAALQTGLKLARERGYTHAVTIDTDGQLDPEQIPELLAAAEASPAALVVGARDATAADYPGRSRLGRRLSNRAIFWASGARVADSQCGFRVYPLEVTAGLRCRARHFGWEAEVITRAAWAGCSIVSVPVRCRYFPGPHRVSHLNPWRETLRAIALHSRLILTRLIAGVPQGKGDTAPRRSTGPI